MAEIARIQADTAGRVHTMGEVLSGRQAELARAVSERLDAVTHRIGQSMQQQTQSTMANLAKLNERLAVIDDAQKNITDLASQVTSLRQVLANKQARGAFGQGRMEAIVQDGLPKGSYEFQYTLSNGKRPDCAIFLPNDDRPLIIDAKFPLEAITALHEARGDERADVAAAPRAPGRDAALHRHRGALSHSGRDAGSRADVRAVGVRSTPSCMTASTT